MGLTLPSTLTQVALGRRTEGVRRTRLLLLLLHLPFSGGERWGGRGQLVPRCDDSNRAALTPPGAV